MAVVLHFMLLVSVGLLATSVESANTDDCCLSCPSMWTQFGQRCYIFHHNKVTWVDGEKQCIEEGGNLASIRTDEEFALVKNIIKTMAGKLAPTWVGGFDAVQENVWQWSDGSKFTFKAWGDQQPNNIGSDEHCLELYHGEKDFTVDTKCSELRSFLCSADL